MNKINFYIISLVVTLFVPFWMGCSDDEMQRSNELGSHLKESGDFKLSTFYLADSLWNIPDSVSQILIRLRSHTDSSVLEYDVAVQHEATKLSYVIYIPKSESIPDSDYDLTASFLNGMGVGTRLQVTFRDEMLHSVMAASIEFDLEGEGTAENPYLIGSKDDFDTFEYGLYRDSISHGAGLYFLQTADFDAPPRSDVYEGRYYAGFSFAGSYDGGSHVINVPYIGSKGESDTSIGLFKSLCDGAQISHLTIKPRMQGIGKNGGALAGISEGNVIITDVTIDGSITDCGENIGGLIGYAKGNLTVKKCRIFASVEGSDYVGGIVGSMENSMLTVDDFSNLEADYTPSLFTVHAQNRGAGGIAGYFHFCGCALSNITFQHSISEEDSDLKVIYASLDQCGGLVGIADISQSSTLSNVQVLAPVRSVSKDTGGLFGTATLTADMSVQRCVVASLVEGGENTGGFFGYLNSDGHLSIGGIANGNRIAQVDNGYLAIKGTKSVGGVIGSLKGNIKASSTMLINVNVSGTEQVGGLFGYQFGNTLEASFFEFDHNMTVKGDLNVGGLVGFASESTIRGRISEIELSSLPLADSFESDFPGEVSGMSSSSAGTSMGGIVGYAKDCAMENLCMTGKVFGSSNVGGIVGYQTMGYIQNCVNNTETIKNTGGNTGGIVGMLEFTSDVCSHLLNYGTIEGVANTGGVFGYVSCNSETTCDLEYAVNLADVSGSNYVGGCVGQLYHSTKTINHTIANSANYGKITNAGDGSVGGIIGWGNAPQMIVKSCANHGEIYSGKSGGSKVGGIAGRLGQDPGGITIGENMEMAYCCNRGSISSDHESSHVGGLLGYQEEGNSYDDQHWMTHDCYNMGTVTSDQKDDNGGIIGCVDHYAEVVNCINVGKVSYGNGVVGTHKDACIWYHHNLYYKDGSGSGWCADSFSENNKKKSETFSGFDFENVWVIDSDDSMNDGYPYLKNCPFQSISKPDKKDDQS